MLAGFRPGDRAALREDIPQYRKRELSPSVHGGAFQSSSQVEIANPGLCFDRFAYPRSPRAGLRRSFSASLACESWGFFACRKQRLDV